jgi:hypothetical protein
VWRRSFTAWTALSLVMCPVTVLLWTRSYRVRDEAAACVRTGSRLEWSVGGFAVDGAAVCSVGYSRYPWDQITRDGSKAVGTWLLWSYHSADGTHSTWGGNPPPLQVSGSSSDMGFGYGWSVFVRYWVALIAFGAAPLTVAARSAFRAAKRRRRGAPCCRICGYDLRATPDRCPECGTPTGIG